MLESFNTKNEMQYQRLTEEEKQKRGILGRLVGIIADFKNSTRNGRRYTEELWDKTFNDPIVKEKIENRCLFGELGHPADRQEIDMEKICICLAEMPKKGNDGKLYGVFDILDTPNGRILKTMCDYGCNIGVSSRGGGDTYEDYNGNETVEPDSYELECWDAVLLPAVKTARPSYVTESLNTKKTLKTALLEALNTCTEDEQKVMKNTLDELNIDYSDKTEKFEEEEVQSEKTELVEEQISNLPEKVDDIDNVDVEELEANNDGSELINELQESLQKQQELEVKIKSLQEQLSVCYTKESRYIELVEKLTSKSNAKEQENKNLLEKVKSLTEANENFAASEEGLKSQITKLNEMYNDSKVKISDLTKTVEGYRTRFQDVRTQLTESVASKSKAHDSIVAKDAEVKKLTEELSSVRFDLGKQLQEAVSAKAQMEKQNKQLVEQLNDIRKNSKITLSQCSAKLETSEKLVEKYKSIAKTAVDKYINSQAVRVGVSATDIKSRLNESYSFKDIDAAVEYFQQYKLDINSLPFSTLSKKKNPKMKITESVDPLLRMKDNTSYNFDDDVDESLLTFTN